MIICLQTGDSWHPDSCTLCQCGSHGDIVCYSKNCPVCLEDSVAVAQPGECCGQCQKCKIYYHTTMEHKIQCVLLILNFFNLPPSLIIIKF